jgi:hypothetical protein
MCTSGVVPMLGAAPMGVTRHGEVVEPTQGAGGSSFKLACE